MLERIERDDWIRESVREACEFELSVYEDILKGQEHIFSEHYEEKIRKIVRGNSKEAEKRKSGHPKMKCLLIAAVIIMLAAGSVMAMEPLKEKVYHMIERVFSDYTEVSFEEIKEDLNDEDVPSGPFRVIKPAEIPEGYRFSEEELIEDLGMYIGVYVNEEDYVLYYRQCYPQGYTAAITSDGTPAKEVSINGYKAYWITDSECNTILCLRDGYLFSVGGVIGYEKLAAWLEKIFEQM